MTPAKIICLGLSAGGLSPLVEFFQHLPDDSGMAFIVIQHFPAESVSRMPTILGRVTPMPVAVAIDGLIVHANHVYTMPSNTQLAIEDGRLRVTPRVSGKHMPIDHFLHSLARECGQNAVGIVLSGYDRDGSRGLVSIKASGGSTFAQDCSAAVGQMPQHAVQTGCVDHVLSPVQMAQRVSPVSQAACNNVHLHDSAVEL